MLVEDNETDVFVIKEVLEHCDLNCRLHVARDGQEALLYLKDAAEGEKSACPDLILLDLNLPKVSGIEVLKHLRASSRCARTPVIIVSSSQSRADRDAVQKVGMEAYFRKPTDLVSYLELVHVIHRILPPSSSSIS